MGFEGTRLRNIAVGGLLGRGGMGEVYQGFDEVLQRRVALKVLRSKCLDDESKARFLREARVLSQLDHSRICRIFDFIEHEGRQILVLEFLEGISLRTLLKKGLSDRLQLRIARQLTEALAAAHGAGVIHRDLKPDNVIVDGDWNLKVLDFGLARRDFEAGGERAAQEGRPMSPVQVEPSEVEDDTQGLTSHGSLMGTAAYMSPEQALGEPITSASDMYSLGIIFHELFTGEPAYDPELPLLAKAQKAAEADTRPVQGVSSELARLIRRLEAKEPSTRPRAVDVLERLDWFEARPRRRRRRLVLATVLILLAAAGAKYTIDLRLEQRRTLAALAQAEEARKEAQQVSDFMVEVFSISDPSEARGNEVKAREILDAGAERLRHELEDQPLVRARLIGTVGRVYHQLGLHQDANRMLEEALSIQRILLEPDDPELASSLYRLGAGYYMVDRYDEARALFEECLRIRRAQKLPDPVGVAAALEQLGQILLDEGRLKEARELLDECMTLRRQVLPPDDPELATGLWTLGMALADDGEFSEAERVYDEAIGILESSPDENLPVLARVLEGKGAMYLRQSRYREAEPLFRRTLEIRQRILEPGHQNLAISASYLSMVTAAEGGYAEAEELLLRALEIFESTLGPDHFNVGANLILLAGVYADTGRLDAAEEAYSRSLSISEKAGLTDNFNGLTARTRLADVLRRQGHLDEAARHFEEALAGWHRSLGMQSIEAVESLLGLAKVHETKTQLELAANLRRQALELARRLVREEGSSPGNLALEAQTELAWGRALAGRGEQSEAKELWRKAARTCAGLPGADDQVDLLALRAKLARALGQHRAAQQLISRLDGLGWVDEEWSSQKAGAGVSRR